MRERRWGEESVVFDTYSGETHHLDPLASAIYRKVSESGAVELEELCANLSPADDGSDGANSPEAIGAATALLRQLGLIRIDDSAG